ncbi:uncharacterized protein B0P05DRAFT_556142 [Gilbertella persicaria]|uniref:uncharacterized protein n=1 Tax=Gilbertella persicaria TaxID=101096 RepID=UPI00221F2F34|nr:uncharacterized protein B0P05DRAFT_556142 [Gilbertella persicaria]KAI8062801.1 hypothetical protein B0P05DRAFT_556142 [Gilbertella persicaria]
MNETQKSLSRSTSVDMKRKLEQFNPTKKNEKSPQYHDVCDACGGVGHFICCDGCPSVFHFTCVEPPLDTKDVAKKDKWYCRQCEHQQQKTRSHPRGLFAQLLDDLNTKNPKAYRLPNDIVYFFQGVTSDKLGRYVDTTQQSKKRPSSWENDTVKSREICYYCRQTGFKKPMIACDYCSLYWHLDCLDPPMASPSTKKWRCPHHIENFIKPPRQQRHQTDITITQPMPSCTYQNYLEHLIEEEKPSLANNPSEDVIMSRQGVVYRLPIKPIQFDFINYVKQNQISKEENEVGIIE